MTDPNPPVTTKQAMPFDSLLAQSRDLVCERLAQALDGMLDKVDETLSALILDSQDRDLRKLYAETKDKALAQRTTIVEQFRAQYLREFQVRSNRVKKIGQSFSDFDSTELELDLVGEDDLNETLKLNDMATKLRQYCDEELVALDQRVGVLLGDANLEVEDNPFSPQAICNAYKHTCRQVDSNVKVRMVMLMLFDDHVLDDIRSVYKAVNALLVQNSILPKIRFRVSRAQESSKAPPSGAPAGEGPRGAIAPPAANKAPSGEQDFFSVLQDLLASNVKAMTQPGTPGGTGVPAQGVAAMPGVPPISGTPVLGGADGAPVVVLQGVELMNILTRVQQGDAKAVADGGLPLGTSAGEPGTTNVLHELKASSLGAGMNQLDSMTLDIVAMLFDQLFDDPKIPIAVKGLIGRMQIPMLKVAIADKAFFSKKNHPARRLLDTLGEIAARLPADFSASNPLFGRLEAIIQELMNNFQDSIEIFDVVREQLQNLVEEEDRRVEEETRAAARRIEQNESLAASKTMAEFEIKARVQSGTLPRPVHEFLVHQWVKSLLIVHVRRGQHSDAWKNSLETMDLLIWSVETKHTPEERRKLATLVPELTKRLAAGLKIAGVEDGIVERFFSDLNALHTEALSMGGEGEVAAAHEASTEGDSLKPDVAPAAKLDAVPTVKPDAMPALEFDAVPATKPDVAPTIEFDTAPAIKPDAAPAAKPDVMPVLELDAAPATKPDALPALEFDTAPATKPAAAPAMKPDALPALEFDTAPAIKPAAAPAAGPAAAPAIKPAAAPAAGPAAAPAARPAAAPGARPTVAPAAGSAAAPAMNPAAAPAARPAAAPPTRPVAAPATRPAAAPPTRPVAAPATRPAAAPPTRPVAAPATKPVPEPKRTGQPIPAMAGKARAPIEAQGADFDSLDFTKSLTIKNPFGGGQVHVEELESADVRASGTPPAKGETNDVEFIKNIAVGSWVEFREQGAADTRRPAKLSYISPLRSSFLFVDKLGKTVKECSRTELGRLVRLGMVAVVEVVNEAPLFDRMMAGVIDKLR